MASKILAPPFCATSYGIGISPFFCLDCSYCILFCSLHKWVGNINYREKSLKPPEYLNPFCKRHCPGTYPKNLLNKGMNLSDYQQVFQMLQSSIHTCNQQRQRFYFSCTLTQMPPLVQTEI